MSMFLKDYISTLLFLKMTGSIMQEGPLFPSWLSSIDLAGREVKITVKRTTKYASLIQLVIITSCKRFSTVMTVHMDLIACTLEAITFLSTLFANYIKIRLSYL